MHTAHAVLPLYARSSQFSFLRSDTQSNERRCHRSSTFITDTFLESIAPLLSNLDNFHIAGCPELETRGVWALLSTNKRGFLSLDLKELSTRFVIHLHLSFFQPFSYTDIQDVEPLSLLSASHTPHPLRRLRSITLSISSFLLLGADATATALLPETFTNLLGSCPLERFQI